MVDRHIQAHAGCAEQAIQACFVCNCTSVYSYAIVTIFFVTTFPPAGRKSGNKTIKHRSRITCHLFYHRRDIRPGGQAFERAGWQQLHREVDTDLDDAQLALPEGASLVVGEAFQEIEQLEGRANKGALWSSGHPTDHLRKLEWVVRAPIGASVGITVVAQRAGTVCGEVNLG
jgi:hypothetical protein